MNSHRQHESAFQQISTETDSKLMPERNPWTPVRPRDRYSTGCMDIRLARDMRRYALETASNGRLASFPFAQMLNKILGTSPHIAWHMPMVVTRMRTPGGFLTAIMPAEVEQYNLNTGLAIIMQGKQHPEYEPETATGPEPLLVEINWTLEPKLAVHGLMACNITSFGGDLPRQNDLVEYGAGTTTMPECVIYPFRPELREL